MKLLLLLLVVYFVDSTVLMYVCNDIVYINRVKLQRKNQNLVVKAVKCSNSTYINTDQNTR